MPVHFVKEAGEYLQGEAVVTVENNKLTVVMTADGKRFTDVTMENRPSGLQSGDKYIVRMSSSGSDLYSLRPIKCNVVAKFDRFSAKKDEPPQPKVQQGGMRQGPKGQFYAKDKLVFTAIFKVISKKYKDMEIPLPLDYTFKQWESSNDTVIPWGSKNKDKVRDFLETCGYDANTDDIPFSENVLPYLEKLLKAKDSQVLLTLNDEGWIDSFSKFANDLEV